MPGLRDEITKTFLRLGRKAGMGTRAFTGDRRSTALPSGTELGTYRILELIGEGGMGQVYLAFDAHLNRKVALKVLPPELTGNAVFLHRFQQEARTASSLNHPNILTIFDFLEIGGHHVIVSEFVEGKTLRGLLTDQIDLRRALDVMAQAASALSAAHAAGVVHRDLKPTNIMVRPDGWVKIIDFGLAKLTQGGGGDGVESWTLPGAVFGTVGYMSPEQARGEKIDSRTDIWSLGVILYEILARSRPFEGTSDSHVIVAILDNAPPPIPHAETLPPGLVAIVDRALAKDKKHRYGSMAELASDLEKVQPTMGSTAKRAPLAHRSRGVRNVAVWLTAAVLLLAAAVWWWPLGGRWSVLEPNWFEIGSSRRLTFVGTVQLATVSPDGSSLAYVAGSKGSETVHCLDLHSNEERQLLPTPGHYLGLTYSPDSRTLFYVVKDAQRETGMLFSAPVRAIGSVPPSLLLENLDSPVAISPNGQQFVFARGSSKGVNQILIGSENDPHRLSSIVSLTGTSVGGDFAWSPRNEWFAAIAYPTRFGLSTIPVISLYQPSGQLFRSFQSSGVRRLKTPVALDGGSLLLFTGMPHGAQQFALTQLFVPTGAFHQRAADIFGLESLSATADSQTLAGVRTDERSSIWVAEKDALDSPKKVTPDAEKITSVEWLGDDSLVFPSARAGNVNLVRLNDKGDIGPVSSAQSCVQTDPSATPAGDIIVYASNCGSTGDDFTIWSVNRKNRQTRPLTSGSNFDEEPSLSPDGRWAYYTSWSSNVPSIWKIAVAGGSPIRVLAIPARAPVLSRDGTKFACTVWESRGGWTVAIFGTENGIELRRLPAVPVGTPLRWSPDGAALDYATEEGISSGIWRQSLSGGPRKALLRLSEGVVSSFSWNHDGTKLAYVRARDQKDAILFTRAHQNTPQEKF